MATQEDTAGAARAEPRECYGVERDKLLEVLYQRITQAHALARTVVGEGFDSFQTYSGDVQHEYLWTIAELLGDARVAYNRLPPMPHAPHRPVKGAE